MEINTLVFKDWRGAAANIERARERNILLLHLCFVLSSMQHVFLHVHCTRRIAKK
jgi:hypothetical protein